MRGRGGGGGGGYYNRDGRYNDRDYRGRGRPYNNYNNRGVDGHVVDTKEVDIESTEIEEIIGADRGIEVGL